ncbi:MAG: prepilin-type N-terminal cleavage/methylation domain-containing protein [Candidatus Omnitrophota bacterium]
MMSLIGNEQPIAYSVERIAYKKKLSAKRYTLNAKKGFTLVEIMVATAILSFGLVMIYQAFFISMDTFDYYLNHLNAQLWMNEKIWQVQDEFRRERIFIPKQANGELVIADKNFDWVMAYSLIVPDELYKINLQIFWKQSSRRVNLLKVAYVSNYAPE